jgi:hypothetical protein
MAMDDYATFIERKTQLADGDGFEPLWLPEFLFHFQRSLVDWALRKGRACIWADCGLGKTPMALVWAANVVRKTNRPVLILAPLAVSSQFIREGEKFGIEVRRSTGSSTAPGIYVTNYERLHQQNSADYAGVVCDEASILKHMTGATQRQVTRFMLKMRYRLLCTATPAPNDFIELGTSSEALGYLGHSEMLARFFKQVEDAKPARIEDVKKARGHRDDGNNYFGKLSFRVTQTIGQYRLKHAAVVPFWRWVASWARACRKPSDVGPFDDSAFVLPELREREHIVEPTHPADGLLFTVPAFGLQEERDERRRTLQERCELVAQLVKHERPAVVWCQMNAEGDLLEKLIPDAVQVAGSDDDDVKEARLTAFIEGRERVLISKAKIAGLGLNMQHCAHVVTFATHCYDEATEVLSREGWKSFGQVTSTDSLATVNQSTLALEWQAPTDVVWAPYVGDMLGFSGQRNFNLLVTPNHKMFVQRCQIRFPAHDGRWFLMCAEAIEARFRRSEYRMLSAPVSADGTRPEHVDIPATDRISPRSRRIDRLAIRDFLELAGWYLSEGHCRPLDTPHAGRIVICQTDKNPKWRAEIIGLMRDRIGLHINDRTKDITGNSVRLASFLIDQFGHGSRNKRIPRWVKDMHPELLVILRDTMMKGDGSAKGTYYKSFSETLRDDFQELCLKTGWRGSVHNDYVSIARTNLRPSVHRAPTRVPYVGMIGCATVPNHTLIVRRNGIPVVSGNSFEQYYQCIRRCYRFGQMLPVDVDIVSTTGEVHVRDNMVRKARQAEEMFAQLVSFMQNSQRIARDATATKELRRPSWLSPNK